MQANLTEKAPPDPKIEKWIKANKQTFIDRYGDKGEEILYATAWKRYNKMNEETIPRSVMPQVASEHLPELLKYLKTKGISYTQEVVSANSLKPVQAINHTAVKAMMNKMPSKQKPILVSSDYKIVDGHHRWAALSSLNKEALVYRLSANFEKVFKTVKSFKHTIYRNDTNQIVEAKDSENDDKTKKDEKPAKNGKVNNKIEINPTQSDLIDESMIDLIKEAKKAHRDGNWTLCYEMIDKILKKTGVKNEL